MWKILLSQFMLVSLNKILVDAHGYLYSPRSRNWVAYEDGSDSWGGSGTDGTPTKEYCYHCLNTKAANEVCGTTSTNNYDTWLDQNGQPIPWNSQETYIEGEIITIKSFLSTNHKGHMDVFVCADGDSSTQECFESNPLEFIEDLSHSAPKDLNYPNRGYYKWGVQDFEMRFKLPVGITGDKVLMQWRYVTGNSCISPGYLDYPWPDPSWLGGNHAECSYPLDPTGAICSGCPEQFWNCAEITILPSNGEFPTASPLFKSPTASLAPSASLAPTSPPVPTGSGCCTIDFKSCSPTVTGWCSESQENCEGSCYKWWLPNGPVSGCNARYESCTEDSDCCSPGVCQDVNGIKTCQESNESTPTNPYPTQSPVTQPSNPSPISPPSPTPPTNEACGCKSAIGMNQPECVENDEVKCNQMILNEGKCSWKDCSTLTPVTPSPTNTFSPTSTPEGCYSNNYRDCLPNGYNSMDNSCTKVWLPKGARRNCVALWEECTGNTFGCCESTQCFGDESYATCIPSKTQNSPTNSPSFLSSSPTKSCRLKGESCNSNADCCKNRCTKSSRTCKK